MSETATGEYQLDTVQSFPPDTEKVNQDRLDALLGAIDAAVAGDDLATASDLAGTYLPGYPIQFIRERQSLLKEITAKQEFDRRVEELEAAYLRTEIV
jgi:hypothetical protein